MLPRSSMALRCGVLALLVLPAVTGCSSNSGSPSVVDGGSSDATTDAVSDTGADTSTPDVTEEPAREASCEEVDAGDLDDADIAAGLQLVGLHRCENCHGSTLSGNKDGVPSLTAEGGLAYPPNLTPDPATGLGCWTDRQIITAILDGIDNQGMALCAPMPRYGHLINDAGLDAAQAQEIVDYLRSRPADVSRVPPTSCPAPPPPVDAGLEDSRTDAGTDASIEAASDVGGDAEPTSDASDAAPTD